MARLCSGFSIPWPTIAGISTGIVAQHIQTGSSLEQQASLTTIGTLFGAPLTHGAFQVGAGGWVISLAAAGVALYRAGAPRLPIVLLVVPAALLYGFDHAVPYGSLCFGVFFLSALWLEITNDRVGQTATSAVQPTVTDATNASV